jgi:hypothetical protein
MRNQTSMLKRLFSNPAIFFLLFGNFYCLWYYQQYPGAFGTIVWIYWFQSVTIGIFNFLDLLTVKNFDANGMKMNDAPVTSDNKGCAAWFFLVHYGIFHLAYGIFLITRTFSNHWHVDKMILLLGIATFFIETLLNFMRLKKLEKTMTMNIGVMFFLPYLRIVPMHLMILLPAFMGIQPSLLFLVLKTIADILSYLLYHRIFSSKKSGNAVPTGISV